MRGSSWPECFSRTRSSAPTTDFLAPTGVVAPGFKPVRSERADGGGRWVAWPARVAHTIGALEPPTTGPGPGAKGWGSDGRGWVSGPARVSNTIGALEPPTTGPGPVAKGWGSDGRVAHDQSRRGGRDRAGRAGGHQVPRPAGGVRPAPTPAGGPRSGGPPHAAAGARPG